MLIQIHMIQNHNASNLNRDDLGAPKTCYFGGVLRSRISSQCIKRSIRTSPYFKELLGGIRTRRLVDLILNEINGGEKERKLIEEIFDKCGIKVKESKKKAKESNQEETETTEDTRQASKMLVYTSKEAVTEMAEIIKENNNLKADDFVNEFGNLIVNKTAVPDMALCGRMLETGVLKGTTVEASLQVAHAFSTHEARPEVDYFIAADDIRGDDAGAGFLDENMYSSACFYKYFSINWNILVDNLKGYHNNEKLAINTIAKFIQASALTTPTGKQNSFAAHNLPDGIIIEFRDIPINYANAFAEPVSRNQGRSVIEQSIAQLAQYVEDIDVGFCKPIARFWFSPNLRYKLTTNTDSEVEFAKNYKSFDEFISNAINELCKKLNLDFGYNEAINEVLDESKRLNLMVTV